MNRLRLSISSLFVAALLLYLPNWLKDSDELETSPDIDALEPTYQAKNLTTKLYNANGNLSHEVFAQEMQHYDLLGFVLFKGPVYTLYPKDNSPPWQLTAEEGTLYENEVIQLENKVVINNLGPEEYVRTARTEYVEVHLDQYTMVSDQLITLTGPRYTITSNGFRADLRSEYYELQDHVQTVYSPIIR